MDDSVPDINEQIIGDSSWKCFTKISLEFTGTMKDYFGQTKLG